MTGKRSGAQRGQDNVAAFQAYVDGLRQRGEALPRTAKGDVNLSKVAAESGIRDRGRFYTNDRLKELLADASTSLVLRAPSAASAPPEPASAPTDGGDSLRRVERRAQRLEQQNSALVAENAELRRQLRDLRLQLGREDMAIETGRRIPSPPNQ